MQKTLGKLIGILYIYCYTDGCSTFLRGIDVWYVVDVRVAMMKIAVIDFRSSYIECNR